MTTEELDAACTRAESMGHERMVLKRAITGTPKRYAGKNRAQLLPGVNGTICQHEYGALVLMVQTADVRRYLTRTPGRVE